MDDGKVRNALRRQWDRISNVVDELDLERESRVVGWRNAEVLAHLAVQPRLLGRFLATAGMANAAMGLEENLAGTHALATSIDALARQDAQAGKFDFARNVIAVDAALAAGDLNATVTTVQGSIRLADYLRTRCVEAVVHGRDLSPPVQPDAAALEATVDALMVALRFRSPEAADSIELPAELFVDIATGRVRAPPTLAHVMPVMT